MPKAGYKSTDEAEQDVLRFLMYYNRTQLHSYNGKVRKSLASSYEHRLQYQSPQDHS
ncbi:hypothetical protein D3C85_1461340 [compost metagenome]